MATIETAVLAEMLRESLGQGQTPRLTVSSGSMAPLLRVGDQIVLEAVAPEMLAVGDIVTVGAAAVVMTHRFWGRVDVGGRPYLLTRGDRPLIFDDPWPQEALIGRVNGRFRHNHYLDLTTGTGQRLNRRLRQLAEWEADLWGSPPQRPRLRRIVRALVYGWARLLAGLSDMKIRWL